uniref:Uncharacterized protein n=1 Tax=Cacopsylla melanoneura TaxID=428564 RepID=A0A8D9BX23_9HEMI
MDVLIEKEAEFGVDNFQSTFKVTTNSTQQDCIIFHTIPHRFICHSSDNFTETILIPIHQSVQDSISERHLTKIEMSKIRFDIIKQFVHTEHIGTSLDMVGTTETLQIMLKVF